MSMSISSIIPSGLRGIQAGIARADVAAGQIARANSPTASGDLATAIVGLKVGELQVKASASVVRSGDQMLGTLIDTMA